VTTPAVEFGSFSVHYDPTTFSITIQTAGNAEVFQVLSDQEINSLLNGFWDSGGAGTFDGANPASMNEVLRNDGDYAGKTNQCDSSFPCKSGFFNFQGINNMY
jgi:hypothetical protein